MALASFAVHAEIRVYESPASAATPATAPAPSPTVSAEDKAWHQSVDDRWRKMLAAQRREVAPAAVMVFFQPETFNAAEARVLRGLFADPLLKGLEKQVYMADRGMEGLAAVSELEVPPGEEFPSFVLDVDNDAATAFGIPEGQPTIVYRDSTGAVRLYNLDFEVDKLQRQLAREQGAAQSRP